MPDYKYARADNSAILETNGNNNRLIEDDHPEWAIISALPGIAAYAAPPPPPDSVDRPRFYKAGRLFAPGGGPWVSGTRAHTAWRDAFWLMEEGNDEVWNNTPVMTADNATLRAALQAAIPTRNGGLPLFTDPAVMDAAIAAVITHAKTLTAG